MEKEKRIKIGLIGCGSAGMEHLKVMLRTKGLEVKVVCDINKKFAERASKLAGVPYYLDAEKMMKNEGLNAIAVITTADAHYKILLLAARYGLHVICEKPLTTKVREGRRVVELFKKRNLLLAITFTYRYVEETCLMKKLIRQGKIGQVVEIRHISWGELPQKYKQGTALRLKYDRMYTPNIRGILFDCGVHTFDLFRWLSGKEYKKFIGLGVCHKGYDYPDSGTILCEMTDKVRCLYDHGPLPYYLGGEYGIGMGIISVAGTKGSLVWCIVAKKENGKYFSQFQMNTKKEVKITTRPLFEKCRDAQHKDFVISIKRGKLTDSFPDPEEANIITEATNKAVNSVLRNVIK